MSQAKTNTETISKIISIDIQQIIAIAKAAGEAIMRVYQTADFSIEHKADNSPLTAADMAAHYVIEAGLKAISNLPILSEESAFVPYETRQQWQDYWLIDPLDGTREFIKRNGEFSVNIALISHHEPVLGVVYAPDKDLLYYAQQGQPAYKQVGQQPPVAIAVKSIVGHDITIAGSRSHADFRLQQFISAITLKNQQAPTVVTLGSSLKICLVAEGVAHVYPRLGPTSEWDTAAAQCVLECANGALNGLSGQKFSYNNKESLLNASFFAHNGGHDWAQYLESINESVCQ